MSSVILFRVAASAGALVVAAAIGAVSSTTVMGTAWAAPQVSQSRSVWSGVYNESQADRGRRLYVQACAECHAQTLMGAEGGPELVGESFLGHWLTKTVGDLYEETASTMPDSAPGTLPERQYVDIIAYMLKENGFPAGSEELPIDAELLKQIRLEPKPQP
jgi:mono/diheme cytochrome c family protein